jgi:DNA-binding XRE family transcriptional regulator
MGKRNNLKQILAEHGSSQTWLAKRAGIGMSTLNGIVNERNVPTLDTARKIAQALGKNVDEIWPE